MKRDDRLGIEDIGRAVVDAAVEAFIGTMLDLHLAALRGER